MLGNVMPRGLVCVTCATQGPLVIFSPADTLSLANSTINSAIDEDRLIYESVLFLHKNKLICEDTLICELANKVILADKI